MRRGESALAGTVERLALNCMQARHRGDIDDVAMPAGNKSTLLSAKAPEAANALHMQMS